MATLPQANLTRLIMQLIKTDQVASLANYANVELVDPAIGIKYATAFYDFNGPQLFDTQDPPQPRDPTSNEMALHFRRELRVFCRDRLNAVRSLPVGQAAEIAERETVYTEVATELGTE